MKVRNTIAACLAALSLAACQDTPAGPPAQPAAQAPRQVQVGYILGRMGTPVQIRYVVIEGRAIWEGDIDVGAADEIARTPEELARRTPGRARLGVAIDNWGNPRWGNRVVPYVIDPGLSNQWRVQDAIAHVQQTTGMLTFVPWSGQADYIRFVHSDSTCSSPVGRKGGQQLIKLLPNCYTKETIHEIGHALGLHHEHTRCDRDGYVEINWGNIENDKEHNFYKNCDGYTDVGSYEESSLMHYPAFNSFAIDESQPTMTSKRNRQADMGTATGLINSDISAIYWMYPLPAWINGPSYVESQSTYTWTADQLSGYGPYYYAWEIHRHGGSYLYPWEPIGNYQQSLSLTMNCNDYPEDFILRVTVNPTYPSNRWEGKSEFTVANFLSEGGGCH